jgi:hypothetical protein
MLDELRRLQKRLSILIADPSTVWSTLDVLYEQPRVERAWTQVGENRLLLHRVHPCEQPYYHPHPWPSAVILLDGRQIMTVGYGPPEGPPPPVAATLHLEAGTGYEMLDPAGWHSVSPQGEPSLSLMLTGAPWETSRPTTHQKAVNRPLTEEARDRLLRDFYEFYYV